MLRWLKTVVVSDEEKASLEALGGAGAGGGGEGSGSGEAVGVGAGLDDVADEGESVDDGGAGARVGEGLGPAAEGLVGGDRDGLLLVVR
jgi:hypothetical protein